MSHAQCVRLDRPAWLTSLDKQDASNKTAMSITCIYKINLTLQAHNEYSGWLEFKSWSQSTLLCKTRLI